MKVGLTQTHTASSISGARSFITSDAGSPSPSTSGTRSCSTSDARYPSTSGASSPSTSCARSRSTSGATASRKKNRIKIVLGDIKRICKVKADIFFVLMKNPTDTTSSMDCEKRIRDKIGKPVSKEIMKGLQFPYPTEWVLTTQGRMDILKDREKELNESNTRMHTGNVIEISEFKDEIPDPESVTLKAPENANFEMLAKDLKKLSIAENQDTKNAGKGGRK